jgi:dihydrofolate synthase/folylpolyglutamate synthase
VPGQTDASGQTFEVDGLRDYGEVRIPLAGEHQLENAALALAALDDVDAAGLRVPVEAARRGLRERTRWAGRLQRVARRPALLLDGAHNPGGMTTLVAYLESQKLRPVVLFGAMKDKDWPLMVEMLAPLVRDAVAARVATPRSIDPMDAARAFSRQGVMAVSVDEVGHAMRTAEGIAGPDGLVLVAGSLYLVGEVLALLEGSP